jgi:hypothetical protein
VARALRGGGGGAIREGEIDMAVSVEELFNPSSGGGRAKIVLHVGCGPRDPQRLHPEFRGPQWREVRVDIDPATEPDLVASSTDLSAVSDRSCDGVWAAHTVEHLYPHEAPLALVEFRRVLRAGGIALIAVPDLRIAAKAILEDRLESPPLYETPAGPVAALDMLYGFRPALAQGNQFMAHHTGFTPRSLLDVLRAAGFDTVELYQGAYEILAAARISAPPK